MQRRLLLVEDDHSLGSTLHERLQKEGYDVCWARTILEATQNLDQTSFDLIILDVGLPDGSGFDLAEKIKSSSRVPFLFMTALSDAPYRLKGFELGAEEYIPKPFHLKELLLRVRHVLDNHAPAPKLECGRVTIDFNQRALIGSDLTPAFLSARDFSLLEFLINSAPKVLSRDEILDQVWGEEKFPSNRTVDNTIVRLRDLLKDEEGKLIRSVRGIGYQWLGPGRTK
jgi:DNA-binding response OmpR family regulator